MADRFQSSIELNVSTREAYSYWRKFESFPRFMDHVRSVQDLGSNQLHWIVDGPMGKSIEFDAAINGDEPGKLISWHSLTHASVHNPAVAHQDVGVQGAVTFDEIGANNSRITVTMQYETPAGPIGELVAKIFSNPQRMVEEDLKKFKQLVESKSLTPYEGAIGTSTGNDRIDNRSGAEYPDSGDIGGITDRTIF